MQDEPQIIYEDDSLLVINKPAGITVNTSDTTIHETTLQNWLESKFHYTKPIDVPDNEADFYNRAGIVHRLDKETSGILLAAKTPQAFVELQRQFKERVVKKTYLALAHGILEPGEGEIRVPVGRLPWNRKRFGVLAGGREAVTKYQVLEVKYLASGKTKEALSLVELYPETGRTHQLRVHLKYFNHPIFADFLYAGRKTSREDRKLMPRVFLHAHKISFLHPATGKSVQFEAPLPLQLSTFLSQLSKQ